MRSSGIRKFAIVSLLITPILIYHHFIGALLATASGTGENLLLTMEAAKLHRISGVDKVVALTFDDGPDPRYTPRVLNILARENIKATFFLIGKQVDKYPYIVRQIIEQGNLVGNHTYSHPDLAVEDKNQIKDEIDKCQAAIFHVTGQQPIYFRPPRGLFNQQTKEIVSKNGLKMVLWDVCVEHKRSRTSSQETKRVLSLVRPGSIILAHDGRLNRKKTIEALPMIIKGLKERGYKFITLDNLPPATQGTYVGKRPRVI
ncbi:MAG: polysaccharide deacetylase family protein [Actinomycetota bacterium]|nr:polysaccharide deacetylase family protein [Actinomycetota bacterium]